jgi:polar amino acid transport system substrate-binding protein
MTSPRPYRDALGLDEALAEVERCAGTQFDPAIARTFLDVWDAGELPREPVAAIA